ncbi:hypothetical protein Cni_G17394 [Canna indica]|uniref:Uncharacterized protein n=1 Tax=Canna indica TaxID=4628 RepID=A0AAQ3QGJ4_9LILI|nr:hypothetical protein Cni_G17394 [Canna indica]
MGKYLHDAQRLPPPGFPPDSRGDLGPLDHTDPRRGPRQRRWCLDPPQCLLRLLQHPALHHLRHQPRQEIHHPR